MENKGTDRQRIELAGGKMEDLTNRPIKQYGWFDKQTNKIIDR